VPGVPPEPTPMLVSVYICFIQHAVVIGVLYDDVVLVHLPCIWLFAL